MRVYSVPRVHLFFGVRTMTQKNGRETHNPLQRRGNGLQPNCATIASTGRSHSLKNYLLKRSVTTRVPNGVPGWIVL